MPGQSIVVYDPDNGLVSDLIAGEDTHQSERTLLVGWDEAAASFIAREHTNHPRLAHR